MATLLIKLKQDSLAATAPEVYTPNKLHFYKRFYPRVSDPFSLKRKAKLSHRAVLLKFCILIVWSVKRHLPERYRLGLNEL